MDNKENKPYNRTVSLKAENKQRECCTCNLPKLDDFQQVISLRNSGLTIFIHKNVEVQKTTRKKSEETFILHNSGERELKRPDYISEMCQFRTKCLKCKTLLQKVRGLMGEIDHIKTDEVIGVCDCCKRSNVTKCRRCEYIVSKYITSKSKAYQNKQSHFVAWLTKINNLLRDILDTEAICKHKLYQESQSVLELDKLLSEFKSPYSRRKPIITYFPTTAAEQLSALEQNKEMLENILKRMKMEKTRHNTSEDGSFLSSSRSSLGCVCKYFMSKNMEGRRSMEVLPQETYYPPGEIDKTLASELRLRGFLNKERHGGGRSSSAEYSRDGTSKGRGRRSIISEGSQGSSYSKDEYGKERGSKRDEYGKERVSKRDGYGRDRDEYGKERGSKRDGYGKDRDEYGKERGPKGDEYGKDRDEYGKERGSKRDGYGKDRDEYGKERGPKGDEYGKDRDEYGKERGSKRDGYGKDRDEYGKERGPKGDEYEKEKGSKKEIPAGAKDKLSGIASQKGKVGEDVTRDIREKNKESTSNRQSSKGNLPKRDTTKEGKIKEDPKEGKSKADRLKDDALKGDTTKTDKNKDAKESKSKADKLKEDTIKGDKEGRIAKKENDTKEGKEAKAKTDKEEDITKTGTKVKKDKSKTGKDEIETDNKAKSKEGGKETKNKESEKKMDKRSSDIALKKKKSSEAALFLKMMHDARPKRDNDRQGKKQIEKPKVFSPIAPLPVLVKKPVKSKTLIPEVSESFVECEDCQARTVNKESIIGKKIVQFEPIIRKDKVNRHEPLLFKIMQSFSGPPPQKEEPKTETPPPQSKKIPISSSVTQIDPEDTTPGIVRYQLSNRKYIEKGWTILPTTKILRKMNTYNMKIVNPEFDFFKIHKKKKFLFYDTGEKLAEIYPNECGKWFYKNGNLALDCYRPEEPNIKKRYVIYSSGDEKENGMFVPITILGLFDQLGNAIIYDYFGNARLKYNQTEGMIIDEKIGPRGRWKWHTLNDPPVLQPVFIDTFLQERDEQLGDYIKSEKAAKPEPSRLIKEPNIDMVMIEFENFVKEKAHKLLQKFKPFQIRMKAVKLNDHFSIRILDQACVTIIFQTTPNTLRLNVGMHLINTEIVDTETSEVSEVATPYDRIPAKTESVTNIQEALNKAKKYGKSIRNHGQFESPGKRSRRDSVRSSMPEHNI